MYPRQPQSGTDEKFNQQSNHTQLSGTWQIGMIVSVEFRAFISIKTFMRRH
jgi:hypothetical protein